MNTLQTGEHLSEEEISLYAEALITTERMSEIPDKIREHAETCLQCKQEILEVYELIHDDPVVKKQLAASRTNVRFNWLHLNKYNLSAYLIAASVLVFAGVFWISKQLAVSSPEDLYDQYMEPYPDILSVKGNHEDVSGKGMVFYNEKDYQSAIKAFNEILKENPDNDTFLLYCGISNLLCGNYKEALAQLDTVSCHPFSEFSASAQWYSVMALLKSGDTDKAKSYLEKLSAGNSIYKGRSENMLKELNSDENN